MVVFSYNSVPFDRLTYGFAELHARARARRRVRSAPVQQRFDLHGRSAIAVPLAIDLAERRLRWLDVHVRERGDMHQVGGYRAALAHVGRDFAYLVASQARPTMWDLATIHAAARANLIYVRERDGSYTAYRRRDSRPVAARPLLSGGNDVATAAIPGTTRRYGRRRHRRGPAAADRLDRLRARRRNALATITRLAAADLIAELAKPG